MGIGGNNMKRKTKNLIMAIVFIVLITANFATIYFASDNLSNQRQIPNMNNTQNTDMNPPEMPNPNNDSNTQEEPPEKPDGENNINNSEIPAMPDENPMDNENVSSLPNNNIINTQNDISILYYILFITECLAISLLIMYLILSHFNKKSFKETFHSIDKVIIIILSSVILTASLTYLDKLAIQKINNNSINSFNNTNNSTNINYSSPYEITEDTTITDGDYTSQNSDENAIIVSGDIDVTLENIKISKDGDSNGGDNTSFYGINSGIIAKDGANLILKNITVETNAVGANGVFSYGGQATTNNVSTDGTTITISDSTITTKKDNSGGIMTTGGGTMIASNLTVTTAGTSSAAIRSDRGGGTVTVDGGTYTTTGTGSPSIYSTADIKVKNAQLISQASEGIVIEGKNSVSIDNCELVDSNTQLNGQSTTYKNIFLYQSMSGDAAKGETEFTAKNSQITTNNGDSFYVTNTIAIINLENNTIIHNDSNSYFLRVQKDSWGQSGSNGGDVTLNLTNQEVNGNIAIDSISTLDMNMNTNSYYEGTINQNNEAKNITLTLDSSSKIKLTGDSYVSSLENSDSTNSNIDFNGYKLYVNGTAIN